MINPSKSIFDDILTAPLMCRYGHTNSLTFAMPEKSWMFSYEVRDGKNAGTVSVCNKKEHASARTQPFFVEPYFKG